jgi:hypothetical protein
MSCWRGASSARHGAYRSMKPLTGAATNSRRSYLTWTAGA